MNPRPMLVLRLSAALVGAVVLPVAAQPKAPLAQLAAGSEIGFATKQMGVPVEGKFGKFSAQIALDPRKPETGSVSFSIDTGSSGRFRSRRRRRASPRAASPGV